MLKVFNTRAARLLLAVAIVVSLTMVAANRFLYQTSIEAVVNAPRIEVQSPTDGVLGAMAVSPGRTVVRGTLLVDLRRDEYTRGTENEIGARAQMLRDRQAALDTQITKLGSLRDSLASRVSAYRTATLAQLASAKVSANAIATERSTNLARAEALLAANGTTKADVERARSELAVANAQAASAKAAHAAAERGVVTGQGAQDVPYSQQRMDELSVQLTNLGAQYSINQAELAELHRTSSVASLEATSDGTITVRATVDGVVWSTGHATGEHIAKGSNLVTLIDCSRLFLDATISPRHQDRIQPGAAVRLRFAGTSREFAGSVAYVRGGGVREDGLNAAQLTLDNRRNDSHAIVLVSADQIGASPGNFCQVGRSAKVIFDGPTFKLPSAIAAMARRARTFAQR